MLSIDLAKKLKSAGLQWEPEVGDLFHEHPDDRPIRMLCAEGSPDDINTLKLCEPPLIWLPRLDQLLAECCGCKYGWLLEQSTDRNRMRLWLDQKCVYESVANTPEDAAAEALLWILERGKE